MGKILIPATSAEDWKRFLAEPDKHWKRGHSARALAYSWQKADGFPRRVQSVLTQTPSFQNLEVLLILPEHQVPLPGGSRSSQNDIWVLARTETELVSIAVEGKVSEPFGPVLREWRLGSSPGKKKRLDFLCSQLGFEKLPSDEIRYQLLHRTVSAVIEAKRFHARYAVMLVHSFSQMDQGFEDYERFLSLFGVSASCNQVISAGEHSGVSLYFAWDMLCQIFLWITIAAR